MVIKDKYNITHRDSWIAIAFVLFISMDMVEQLFSNIFGGILPSNINSLVFDVLRLGIAFFGVLMVVQKKELILKLIAVLSVIVALIALTLMVNPQFKILLSYTVKCFVGTYVPALAIGMCIYRNDKVLVYSFRLLPIVYLYLIYNIFVSDLTLSYQDTAYSALYFAMMTLALYCQKPRIDIMLHYIVLLVAILYVGARGPLLCLVLWTAFLFYYTDKTKVRMCLTIFGLIALAIFYWGYWDLVIEWLYGLFPSSRTIVRLYEGTFFTSSDRAKLYGECISQLKLLDFQGLMSDRFFLVNKFQETSKLGFWIPKGGYQGTYAHNIWIELCFCFGIIFGTVILLLLLWRMYKVLRLTQKSNYFYLICVIMIVGFVPLVFSKSFLSSSSFWIMMGVLCMNTREFRVNKGCD